MRKPTALLILIILLTLLLSSCAVLCELMGDVSNVCLDYHYQQTQKATAQYWQEYGATALYNQLNELNISTPTPNPEH